MMGWRGTAMCATVVAMGLSAVNAAVTVPRYTSHSAACVHIHMLQGVYVYP
jgi:hypothetical protein